jgi:hypothetical protein
LANQSERRQFAVRPVGKWIAHRASSVSALVTAASKVAA